MSKNTKFICRICGQGPMEASNRGAYLQRVNPKGEVPIILECRPSCGHSEGGQESALVAAAGAAPNVEWNKNIRDSVDKLLEQAGYAEDSSARHQLSMMNFDVAGAAPVRQEPDDQIQGLGEDESAFIRWAEKEKYDLSCHPMFFVMLNEKTYAARMGWKAAKAYYGKEAQVQQVFGGRVDPSYVSGPMEEAPAAEGYVQPVPDHCDRITWRNSYYHLPLPAPAAKVPEWMPIETAPKDGQCLLWVKTDDGGEVMTLTRDADGAWIYEGEPTYSATFYIEPTHWRPLPSAPEDQTP